MWCGASSGHVTPSLTWTLPTKDQLVGSGAPNHRGRKQRLAVMGWVGPVDPCLAGSPMKLCRPLSFLQTCAMSPSRIALHCTGALLTQNPKRARGDSIPVLCTCLAPLASKWFQDPRLFTWGHLPSLLPWGNLYCSVGSSLHK